MAVDTTSRKKNCESKETDRLASSARLSSRFVAFCSGAGRLDRLLSRRTLFCKIESGKIDGVSHFDRRISGEICIFTGDCAQSIETKCVFYLHGIYLLKHDWQ